MQWHGAEPNYISKIDGVGILIEYCYKQGRPQSMGSEKALVCAYVKDKQWQCY